MTGIVREKNKEMKCGIMRRGLGVYIVEKQGGVEQ
jgi:hypothetical protein